MTANKELIDKITSFYTNKCKKMGIAFCKMKENVAKYILSVATVRDVELAVRWKIFHLLDTEGEISKELDKAGFNDERIDTLLRKVMDKLK